MNWIKTLLFLVIIFTFYRISGKVALEYIGYRKINSIKEVLAGFIILFFIGFVIGVPSQLFHVNWFVYKYLMISSVLLVSLLCVFKKKRQLIDKFSSIKNNGREILINHIQQYWFVYLLVIAFTFLAITNTLPYYRMNYDDSYYIGKIVNQTGSIALMNENYYNGCTIASGFDGGITRIFNTFEIMYGFLAELFLIDIPFFCRVSMAVHNYLMVFLTYKSFAEMFINKRFSQFSLIPFSILLICSGFMMTSGHYYFNLRMYDGWQFQTAIFYGGSVVRTLSIPIILLFGVDLFEKIELKKICFMAVIFLTFMSFSTIFLQYAILLVLFFMVVKTIYCLLNSVKEQNKRNILGWSIFLVIILSLFIISKKLDHLPFINTPNYKFNVTEFKNFYYYYFGSDVFARYGPFILTVAFFIFKTDDRKNITLFTLLVYLLFYCDLFEELIVLTSFNTFFVSLRFMTSIQMMVVIYLGVILVELISKVKWNIKIFPILSISILLVISISIYKNKDLMTNYDFAGSGITKTGYSLKTIMKNDKMMPNIMVDIGDYFNSLEYGNYSLVLPNEVPCDETTIPGRGFIITSNRIELIEYFGSGVTGNELNIINSYYLNNTTVNEVDKIIKKRKLDYILVFDENKRDELKENGYEVKFEKKESNNEYYLLKTPY